LSPFVLYIATACALILVIEGLVYALFPDAVRRMFAAALAMPPERLRLFGAAMAASGFCLVAFLQSFTGN